MEEDHPGTVGGSLRDYLYDGGSAVSLYLSENPGSPMPEDAFWHLLRELKSIQILVKKTTACGLSHSRS